MFSARSTSSRPRSTQPFWRKPPPTSKPPASLDLPPQTLSWSNLTQDHLALIGELDWARYWYADLLVQLKEGQISTILLGSERDDALTLLPYALGLPPELFNVRPPLRELPNPSEVQARFGDFIQRYQPQAALGPSVLFVGRSVGQNWLFALRYQRALPKLDLAVLADISLDLKLPLNTLFKRYLVQRESWPNFEAAVERWYRHHAKKPELEVTPVPQQDSLLIRVLE